MVAYWSLFNSHAIERALAPFTNVVRILPSSGTEKSIQVLQQRSSHLLGTNAQGFDWSTFFVNHEQNQLLAKYEVYTEGKSPAETCAEIISLTQAHDQVKASA